MTSSTAITLPATTKFHILVVGGLSHECKPRVSTEFEVHAPNCAHIARRIRDGAHGWTIEAASPEAAVAEEAGHFQDHDQGWDVEDFKILGCAIDHAKATMPAPVVEEAPVAEEADEVTPEVAQAELDRRAANKAAKKTGAPREEATSEAAFKMSAEALRAVVAEG